jgi:hypothetical protein
MQPRLWQATPSHPRRVLWRKGAFLSALFSPGDTGFLGCWVKVEWAKCTSASTLILNQTVALKFLAAAQYGEAALARFRNEVRVAREVIAR